MGYDMVKMKRLGGSFSHAYSSTLWKKSKYIEYSENANVSISIDDFNDADYAWLHESKSIIPHQYKFAKHNFFEFKKKYKFVFTHDQDLISLDPTFFKFVPACGYWIDDPHLHKKSKLLSFITSNKTMCEGHRYRLHWKDRLNGKCDIFGRGIKEISKKEDGLNDYMFSIAIENGKYDTYFTEKILDCFATGTIPVYHGTEKISDYFNPDGIIMLTDSFSVDQINPDLYYSKINAIQENFERVLNYYTVEDWIHKNYEF
jgi:hypothetical protein